MFPADRSKKRKFYHFDTQPQIYGKGTGPPFNQKICDSPWETNYVNKTKTYEKSVALCFADSRTLRT